MGLKGEDLYEEIEILGGRGGRSWTVDLSRVIDGCGLLLGKVLFGSMTWQRERMKFQIFIYLRRGFRFLRKFVRRGRKGSWPLIFCIIDGCCLFRVLICRSMTWLRTFCFCGLFIMTPGGRFTGHSPWAHGRGSCHICVAAEHGAYGVVFYILVQIKDSNRNNSIACSRC